jgi:Fe-S oxidoreductase
LEVPTLAALQKKGTRPEFLFFVGCSAAFDPRNQRIARSVARILNACGISYGVLGEEEACTGDFLRRIGHEHLFQQQCRTNLETLSRYAFDKILTLCPHCHHTFKTDYPQFGGSYPVVHHTELIAQLIQQEKIRLSQPYSHAVTYHDPCYLGRYNGVFDPPRAILEKVKGAEIVEMERSRMESMCCGAGGGLMWLEEDPHKRVNCLRIKQAEEALARKNGSPAVIAVACPFCMTMLEDGLAGRKGELQCRDIAEIAAQAMGLGEP